MPDTTKSPLKRASSVVSLLTLLGTVAVLVAFGVAWHQLDDLNSTIAQKTASLDSMRHLQVDLDTAIIARTALLDSLTSVADRSRIDSVRLGRPMPSAPLTRDSAPAGKRAEVLKLALSFVDSGVPFHWGGKTPSDGFDSSGFVAYILAKEQLLERPETYWSGALRAHFAPGAPKDSKHLMPGDLVFYRSGYCAFYIGQGKVAGMLLGEVQVADLDWGPEILGFGRVKYDQT